MNIRIVVFALVALILIGLPAYIFIDEKVSGGIKNMGDYVQVNLKAMSSFEMDQNNATDQDVPEKWRALNGKKVAVEGEMWTQNTSGASTPEFELVYSIAKCCFSGPPQVQHFVLARMPTGKDFEVYSGLVRVTGTLHVKVEHNGGKVSRVYSLDVDKIEPV